MPKNSFLNNGLPFIFVIEGIARDVPMYTIFKGVWLFVIAMAFCISLLILFPQIALFLPFRM